MKLHYYPETDNLYIELLEKPGVATLEIRDGLNADVDGEGNVVGFDIDHLAALFAAAGRSSVEPGNGSQRRNAGRRPTDSDCRPR